MIEAYEEGLKELKAGDVLFAAKKFNEAETLFPQSEMAPRAALMAAYSYYSDNYDEEFPTFTTSNKELVKATSSGPCIFGLTIYTEPVLEFFLFLKSCKAHKEEKKASIIPSGISYPSFKIIDGLVIK